MLDVRRLRLLRELSRRGTIAAVAGALSYTPSAVSQQLSALEREAGVPLLERTGRRVVLTPAAERLVVHAEAVLEQLERAAAELAGARRGLAGPVRIATFQTAARMIIPAALERLAERHPDLEPMVSERDPADVADGLRSGELDVALVHDYDFVPTVAEPGLSAVALCREHMYLATATAGRDGGAGLRDQRGEPWITATPGTLCHAMTVRACEAEGFTPRIRHQVDDFGTTLRLVAGGQGVALVPQLGVVDAPEGVVLTRVPIYRRTMIAFRSGADGHPAVAAVSRALRAAVPEGLAAEAPTPYAGAPPGMSSWPA